MSVINPITSHVVKQLELLTSFPAQFTIWPLSMALTQVRLGSWVLHGQCPAFWQIAFSQSLSILLIVSY